MTQKKISDLPLANAAGDSDLVPMVQEGVCKAIPATLLRASPPGLIATFAAGAVPDGFIECDGRAVSRVTCAALFAVIGTAHGAGNGENSFNVPNLPRRYLPAPSGPNTITVAVPGADPGETVTIAVAAIVHAIKT